MEKWENKKTQELIGTMLKLKTAKEARCFLRDLLTEREILEFGNRWKAARMLWLRFPYEMIQKETGLSSRTIARISTWLTNGKGGYRLMIERLNKMHKKPFPVLRKG